MKVTVIGAGNVGAKAVYYIAEKNIADIVMVDVVDGLAQSKALDFLHAAPLRGYEVGIRGTTDFAEMAGSDVVVLTAGIARKPGMDRMDLLRTNVGIARQAAREIARRAPNAVVIVVTNPLDVIAMAVLRETGFALSQGDRHGRRPGFHPVSLLHRGAPGSLAGRRAGHGARRSRGRHGPPHELHLGGRHPHRAAPGLLHHREPWSAGLAPGEPRSSAF